MDNPEELLDDIVSRYADALVATTQELLRIDTVSAAPCGPDAPFGPGLRAALDYYLALGREIGWAAAEVDGYAGHVEHGDGAEMVGVLSHLDVVPPGDGWSVPPFGGLVRDGKLYGRGAIDDKGPTMAALWALHAVRRSGLPLRRRVRAIVGTDEELRGRCMARYFAREPMPTLGFTPDAAFPLVNAEKGVLLLTLYAWPETVPDDSDARIVALSGGQRPNVVPARAECVLALPPGAADDVTARVWAYAASGDHPVGAAAEYTNRVRVWAAGAEAHAGMPQSGHNAIGELLLALDALDLTGGRAGALVRVLARTVGVDCHGVRLGIGYHDEPSGPLTLNLGVISGDESGAQATLDVRYPVTRDAAEIVAVVRQALAGSGVSLSVVDEAGLAPHVVATDTELVRTLRRVYRETVGGDDTPLAIGGATYARAGGTMVAFGPGLPGRPQLQHCPDEHIGLDDLLLLARIYARAIYALACA